MNATETTTPSRAPPTAAQAPQLIVILEGAAPTRPGTRYLLDDVDEVQLGRARKAAVTRAAGRLSVSFADTSMSQPHTRIFAVRRAFVLEDLGSKNGTHRNGNPTRRAELDDGDVLVLGRTAFLFRKAPARAPAQPDFVDDNTAFPLRTYDAALASSFDAAAAALRRGASVLVVGPPGSGRTELARALANAAVADSKAGVVELACGTLGEAHLGGVLFGVEAGAHAAATESKAGALVRANGGALLLDDVDQLARPLHAPLCEALERGQVTPLGGSGAQPFRCAVVATARTESMRDPSSLLLWLSSARVELPPLAQRRCDLGLIVASMLRERPKVEMTAAAVAAIAGYTWPHGMRELQRALRAAGGDVIDAPALGIPDVVAPPVPELSEEDAKHREQLVQVLEKHQGNISTVARELGKGRTQIHRWLKRYGLSPEQFRR